MKQYISLIVTITVFLIGACRSAKTVSGGEANFKLSTKQLIKANTKQSASFRTLQSKLKITLNQDGKKQSHVVTFRVKKDEILWISAAFSVIRAKVTPDKVSFYNKLDNTYFEGDYKYLSDMLGTELDFQKVQNLLVGETLFNLKNESYKSSVDDEHYVVRPKKQRELFEIFFLLDPTHFKVKSQQISQPQELRHLEIDYTAYQKVDGQLLPERIKVNAVEANDELVLNLEFKAVTLNEDLRFPFRIPSGFEEIIL